MSSIKRAVAVGVALGIIFILAANLILPYFSSSYRYCQDLRWEGATGNVYTNCTNRYQDAFNTSYVACVYETIGDVCVSHTENGITSPINNNATNISSYCLNCLTAGGYRIATRGLVLLVLVLGLIGFGIYFLPRISV